VRQILCVAGGGEIGESLGHSIKAEGVKLIEGWMFEHVGVS
jgi:prephenate dehydrogenase